MSENAYVNELECRVIGMSRSGNHAIINWILQQAEGRRCFLNCAEPRTNPFFSARPLGHGRVFETSIPGFDIDQEKQGDFSRKDLLLHSYEDVFLGAFARKDAEAMHDRWVGPSRYVKTILIFRDALNLFASRMKFGMFDASYKKVMAKGITPKTTLRIWKQHARQFLGERNYFRGEWCAINFNRWTSDAEYRGEIAHRLGLPFTDKGFHVVTDCAGGSSFDGVPAKGNRELRVNGRWEHFVSDPEYRGLFDEDSLKYCKTIFGLDADILFSSSEGEEAGFPSL